MRKIKKGDEVILICGKDKGKRGKILKVLPDRFMVEGLNLVKKHVRPNPQAGVQGGIVTQEASIHCSNVAIWNPETQKADKVAIRTLDEGERVRVFKSNNELVDQRA